MREGLDYVSFDGVEHWANNIGPEQASEWRARFMNVRSWEEERDHVRWNGRRCLISQEGWEEEFEYQASRAFTNMAMRVEMVLERRRMETVWAARVLSEDRAFMDFVLAFTRWSFTAVAVRNGRDVLITATQLQQDRLANPWYRVPPPSPPRGIEYTEQELEDMLE